MTAPVSGARTDGLHTLGRWPADRARIAPDHAAVVDRGVALGYGELEARVERLAQVLLGAGIGRGMRVATLVGNSADHVVLFFACARVGAALCPLSWRLTPPELVRQVQLLDPALLATEEETGALADEVAARLTCPVPTAYLTELGRPGTVSAATGRAPVDPEPVDDEDALLVVFTSGSLSAPKAAVLSHRTCWWTNLSLSRTLELTERDVVLAVLPQFHAGGWNIQPLLAWWTGATVVLERTFDPGRVLSLVREHRVSTMMGVPTQYLLLAEHPGFVDADLSTLRSAVVGGAPMPPPLLRTFHARGVALTQGYGLTEAGPNVLCLPPHEVTDRAGWAGVPYPHVEVALADAATGERVRGAGTGELLVRGPGLFTGYLHDEEATAQVMHDGWLWTGDVATRDEQGYLKIVDRLRNIYISGGENVAPAEVEAALRRHPAVASAAVVGLPHERWGEVGVALVVLRPGVATDEHDLREHCRALLAAFKVPERILAVPDIPQVGIGKNDQPAVRALARERLERQEQR
ncbi:Long-chain-fatty-acid--CoA ligase [Serinicoccus hydrothermalis]|uniref:Long-chain-fatty-acid--CoA ligase n=1 Tax=Serinicoccus hydrothermalis TaxID=1758689 RepID=A0A1B1NFZ7_9MICO|nr:AMP-binding protein [Serinicoccus hydrothermalis]ANS80356.1 Long-chain-fatty-acid--CoA ligase [Serinicoccus hydrothermalis]